jgi:hypothetical protein
VLTVDRDGEDQTVRVYDGAHGVNDLHRYSRSGGKQPAETCHSGTLAKGCGRDRRLHRRIRRDDPSLGPMTTPPDTPRSAASRAMLDAVDGILRDGTSAVPERATFVDADDPTAGVQIARAAADGRAVVLCSADGTRQVLYPRAPAAPEPTL